MQAPFSEFWWAIGIGTVTLVILAVAFVAALVVNQRRFIETQRHQLRELRQSEEKYRNLFENSLVGMIRISLADLLIVDCNKTACEIFGGTSPDDIRASLQRLDPRVRELLKTSLIDSGAVENLEANVHGNRTIRWVSITCRANVKEGYAEGVVADITKRKEAEEQLRESHLQLRNLSSRLESVREEERVRIARQVHDELGQILTAVKIHLTLLNSAVGVSPKRLRDTRKTDTLIKIIDDAIDLVRNISNDLRPLALEESGLKEAIEWEAKQFEQRTGINCSVMSSNGEVVMKHESATAVFRIFQEALTNIARHAQAQNVRIRLAKMDDEFSMEIVDDGKGFLDTEVHNPKALGILGMRERAVFLGGSLSITHGNASGTVVGLTMPLKEHLGKET